MIERSEYVDRISAEFEVHSVVAILGPRQIGKTTLAKQYANTLDIEVTHFDLENPLHLSKLKSPNLSIGPLKGLIIIDEIQLKPELFSFIRYLVDSSNDKKFLVLGSASQDLINQSSQSLAGRIAYIELTALSIRETEDSWLLFERGGFPKSYLAKSNINSYKWRQAFIKTFVERDLASFGINISPRLMESLWMMLAHYHANIINYTELARSIRVSDSTIRRYVDILAGCFMLRILRPWHENISKRQVKLPKIYIRDSGLLHTLLGTKDKMILNHPKLGAAWEGFALEQVIDLFRYDKCYFWASHEDAEIDLVVFEDNKRFGFEFKYTDFPKITKSMRIALQDLRLDSIKIIIPGNERFNLSDQIEVVGLDRLRL